MAVAGMHALLEVGIRPKAARPQSHSAYRPSERRFSKPLQPLVKQRLPLALE
jgi:hypothetical protein